MSEKCVTRRIRLIERFSYLSIIKLSLPHNFEQIWVQTQKYLGSLALGTSHIMTLRSSAVSDRRHIFLDPPDLFSCNQPYEFRRIILQSPHVVVRGSKSHASCQNSSYRRKHLRGQLNKSNHLFPQISHCPLCSCCYLHTWGSLRYNGMFFSHTSTFSFVPEL